MVPSLIAGTSVHFSSCCPLTPLNFLPEQPAWEQLNNVAAFPNLISLAVIEVLPKDMAVIMKCLPMVECIEELAWNVKCQANTANIQHCVQTLAGIMAQANCLHKLWSVDLHHGSQCSPSIWCNVGMVEVF
jgi:hypothetical protein